MIKPRNFAQQLSPEMLQAFDDEVRKHGYGQSQLLADWLMERGVKSSKSAVCRYEVALRERDGINAKGGSVRAIVAAQGTSLDSLHGLYRRLGELEFEREEILGMIRDKLAEEMNEGAH
ncbi:hypothetical protein OB962_18445 [Aeromonas piscicola]|uniref:DUF3486 family protein n=1 Tax=Aeromonas piscicola TaxID=600645 RepID=A0ABT7QG60_9GAMM|nr:hypothetical protein [Aeromonas piscicola]MDM5132954.1 hypothetical protein [Aeromonas piscicola]